MEARHDDVLVVEDADIVGGHFGSPGDFRRLGEEDLSFRRRDVGDVGVDRHGDLVVTVAGDGEGIIGHRKDHAPVQDVHAVVMMRFHVQGDPGAPGSGFENPDLQVPGEMIVEKEGGDVDHFPAATAFTLAARLIR